MKLEMDLIRDILIWCRNNLPEQSGFHTSKLEFPGYTRDQVGFHIKLLVDNGYLEANNVRTLGSRNDFLLNNLTWDGYDFLSGIENDTVWNGIKEEAGKIGVGIFKSAIPVILQILAKQAGLA